VSAQAGLLGADWPAPPGVRACTTLRCGAGVSQAPFDRFNLGSRCGDDPAAVEANRAELRAMLALPASPRWLRQLHGTDVARFGEGAVGAPYGRDQAHHEAGRAHGALLHEPEADAAVTAAPGVVLAILTADCLPVVFAAHDGSEVAAAHAGWRGLAGGVLEATLAAMRTPPQRVIAWLGPAAGPDAYEVGAEVRDAFVSSAAATASAFASTRPGHWRADLYALARHRLAAGGLAPAEIHGGGLCTMSDPARFFSHRRDQRTGRMATLVWMDKLAR
jgi:YfiH family protein